MLYLVTCWRECPAFSPDRALLSRVPPRRAPKAQHAASRILLGWYLSTRPLGQSLQVLNDDGDERRSTECVDTDELCSTTRSMQLQAFRSLCQVPVSEVHATPAQGRQHYSSAVPTQQNKRLTHSELLKLRM